MHWDRRGCTCHLATGLITFNVSPLFPAVPEVAPSPEVLLAVGRRMVTAFQRSGFIYLQGHGISRSLQEDTFAASRDFFALEDADKRRFTRFENAGYNGYTAVGAENTGKLMEVELTDLKECYDFFVIGEVNIIHFVTFRQNVCIQGLLKLIKFRFDISKHLAMAQEEPQGGFTNLLPPEIGLRRTRRNVHVQNR